MLKLFAQLLLLQLTATNDSKQAQPYLEPVPGLHGRLHLLVMETIIERKWYEQQGLDILKTEQFLQDAIHTLHLLHT